MTANINSWSYSVFIKEFQITWRNCQSTRKLKWILILLALHITALSKLIIHAYISTTLNVVCLALLCLVSLSSFLCFFLVLLSYSFTTECSKVLREKPYRRKQILHIQMKHGTTTEYHQVLRIKVSRREPFL